MRQPRSPLFVARSDGGCAPRRVFGQLHADTRPIADTGTQRPRRRRLRSRRTRCPSGVLGLGIGTFDLAAIPVATLKNEAKYHGAAAVVVHFVTHRSGKTLGSLESVAVNLAPGETLAVTRRLHRRLQRGHQRRRDRHGRVLADGHRTDLHDGLGRLQLPAVPHRSWLRQRDRDPHSIREFVGGSGCGGVRRVREQGWRDLGRRLRGVRLAGGIDAFCQRSGRAQRRAVLVRARGLHRLVGSVRSV